MKRFALIGLPNTGKSTLFNRLTGLSQRVGNWPGLTVEIARAKILLGGHMVDLIDLPGINDLSGYAEDEAVVRQMLTDSDFHAFVVILNATQLDRQLRLALQLRATGVPLLVLLNMSDEARQLGITVDEARLSKELGAPVLMTSARRGENWPAVLEALARLANGSDEARHAVLPPQLADESDAVAWSLAQRALADATFHVPPRLSESTTEKVDRWLLHPWLGLPLFFVLMAILFQLTYLISTPIQDGLDEGLGALRGAVLDPLLSGAPSWLSGFLFDGVWTGMTTVLTFAPLVFVFFVLMAIVEDAGYLARAAFLMDAMMSRLGLDGRGFVMHLMGFGCNVPAIMGTRIMRDRKMRLLSMLTIPFSVCSARLQVFLFFSTTMFSPLAAPWVLFSLYLVSFAVAMLSAWLFKRGFHSHELFVLEIPPYRLPTPRHLLLRAWGEVRAFLKLASTMILIGVVLVWALTTFHIGANGPTFAEALGHFFRPLLAPIGIEDRLAVALMFGFVAKEILLGSMAVIYGVQENNLGDVVVRHIDWISAYSFMLFTLIYVPCVATVAAIYKESKSFGFTTLSVAWSLGLAWVVSFVFYQSARLLVG